MYSSGRAIHKAPAIVVDTPSARARGARGAATGMTARAQPYSSASSASLRPCARCHRPAWAPAARRRGSARLPRWFRAGNDLVTRGQGRRGPRRAQFRSAPSSEHTPQQVSSSSTARVRAARGLFEHGEAHRRACPRGRAFSLPPDGATRPLLGDQRLVAEADDHRRWLRRL